MLRYCVCVKDERRTGVKQPLGFELAVVTSSELERRNICRSNSSVLHFTENPVFNSRTRLYSWILETRSIIVILISLPPTYLSSSSTKDHVYSLTRAFNGSAHAHPCAAVDFWLCLEREVHVLSLPNAPARSGKRGLTSKLAEEGDRQGSRVVGRVWEGA